MVREIPSITPNVLAFADDVVDAGCTVVLPLRLGIPGGADTVQSVTRSIARHCVAQKFETWRTGRTSAVTEWVRALAADLHTELGGPGGGALGRCFSGGFALAMMPEGHVDAAVLSQPSLPFTLSATLKADLGLSPADLFAVKGRVASGCPVSWGRATPATPLVGSRCESLPAELGSGFRAVEPPGKGHSVLPEHRDEESVSAMCSRPALRAPTASPTS
ncbi:MAG: dienelactone hydrolase family protein [Mycobacteriales bacterium]